VILLDTHAAIWLAANDNSLGEISRTMALAARSEDRLAISAISFWEIALLTSKGRLELAASPAVLRMDLLNSGVIELPLTGAIALQSVELQLPHSDPADRFIAATAVLHNATLLTADKRLLQWRHKIRRQNAAR